MRLNRSHMEYIPTGALKSTASFRNLNTTPVFRSTYSKTSLVLFANESRLTVFCCSNGQNPKIECGSLSLSPQHVSLELRWRRSMLGYIGRCKKLVFQLVRGLVPLVLIVPTHVRAQTQPPPPTDAPKRARAKAAKKKSPARVFVLVGAGDIASCQDPEGARATAKLIEQIPGTVFAAGDLAYEKGSAEEFKNCYDPAWGRFKDRTKPALGNHEYADPTASGYFEYWGAQAGSGGKGFYIHDLGAWHIVVMNTNSGAPDPGRRGTRCPYPNWLKETF